MIFRTCIFGSACTVPLRYGPHSNCYLYVHCVFWYSTLRFTRFIHDTYGKCHNCGNTYCYYTVLVLFYYFTLIFICIYLHSSTLYCNCCTIISLGINKPISYLTLIPISCKGHLLYTVCHLNQLLPVCDDCGTCRVALAVTAAVLL